MLITPTGIPYDKLTESHIVSHQRQRGSNEEAEITVQRVAVPYGRYQTRPDAQAVVHNHAVHCTAVSNSHIALSRQSTTCDCSGWGTLFLCAYMRRLVRVSCPEHVDASPLKTAKQRCLQHHGLIARERESGKSSLWLAHEVEVLAPSVPRSTLAIADPVPVLDDEEIAIVLEKFKSLRITR